MVEIVNKHFEIKCICGNTISKDIILPAVFKCKKCKLAVVIAKSKKDLYSSFNIPKDDLEKPYGFGTHGKLEISCSCGRVDHSVEFKSRLCYFECQLHNCSVFLIAERYTYITDQLSLDKFGNYRAKKNNIPVDYIEF